MKEILLKELPELKNPLAHGKFSIQTKEWREKRRKDLEQKLSSNLTHYDTVATKKNDLLCIFAGIGIILQIYLLIIDYDTETRSYIHTERCYYVKILISVTSAILILLQINYYHVLAIIEDTKWGFPTIWSGFFNSSLIYKAAFEIILCAIHPLPIFPPEYDCIGLFMVFRGFLFFRFLKYHSRIFRQRNRILRDNPFLRRKRPIYGWKLVMKMYFYTHSVTTVVVVYAVILIIGAFFIHIAERADNPSLTSYGNALYFTIISTSSIGYGDISPKTSLGKVIDCSFAIIGIVTLSFIVSMGDKALRMRSVELFSVESMGVMILDSKRSNISAEYIQNYWKLRKIMKRYGKWPYNSEEAAELNIFQQRIVAVLIGRIKDCSRSMHRYRIRQMALSTFYKKDRDDKKEEVKQEKGDEEKSSIKKRNSGLAKDQLAKEMERKIRERKHISLIKQGFNLK